MTGPADPPLPGAAPIAGALVLEPVDSDDEIPFSHWPDDVDSWCALRPHSDLGNSERLRARHGDDFVFVPGLGWHAWDGRRWDRDGGEDRLDLAAQRTVHAIAREAKVIAAKDEARSVALLKHGRASGGGGHVAAMQRLARAHLRRPLEAFDASPELLTCANGVIELGIEIKLRPHRRADLCTKLAPVAYDERAEYPLFKAFLEEILPNPEVREFIQRWFGYCTTALTSEQVMTVFHGTGANGKSTLVEAVRSVMGDYALTLPIASLLRDDKRRGGEPTPDLARLPAARLVTATEPEIGRWLSELTIKQLTGEDRLVARKLHQEFFEFEASHKLIVCCNRKPSVRGSDEGIWRRLLLVPFGETIPPHARSKTLKAELRQEAAGILNWIVQGAALYFRDGLNIPEAVRAATDSYRADCDPVGRFLADWCRHGPSEGSIRAGRLYEAYRLWCRQAAVEPVTLTRFGLRLADRGITKWTSNGTWYPGLGLTEVAERAVAEAEVRRHGGGDDGQDSAAEH